MKIDLDVDVHHLARIEGHGNIVVRVRDGQLAEARWDIVETPRFFEVMLQGKHFGAAALLTSRICGICSISHSLASLQATEAAFEVTVPPAGRQLRLLAKHGETLQSHILHLAFLALPDFVKLPSVLPLIETQPEIVHMARRLKGLANRICDVVAGRTTHPVTFVPGGVTTMPERRTLRALRAELERSRKDFELAAEVLGGLEIPDFARETEFVSLAGEGEYPFLTGSLVSTDGVHHEPAAYREMTNEYIDKHNTSKWCKLSRDSFAVGPLARFNNNHAQLGEPAASLAMTLGLVAVSHNPFHAHLARLVECVQAVAEMIDLIDELTSAEGQPDTQVEVQPRAGEGVGAVEAPRGILYHHYVYDDEGRIAQADCVIPTTQNNANIHQDLGALAQHFARKGMTDAELELLCSMLVRSYDPCVSCSVH